MLPFMAQGAAQAIEDGAALAACIADMGDRAVADTLLRYESLHDASARNVLREQDPISSS